MGLVIDRIRWQARTGEWKCTFVNKVFENGIEAQDEVKVD